MLRALEARRFSYTLLLAVVVAPALHNGLYAEEKPRPVSYDLKVNIEPVRGHIAVRGTMELPPASVHSAQLKFGLHETFVIKRLSINGRDTTFSFRPAEPSPINPATKNVIVALPANAPQDRLRMDIEYEGQLKALPEFGTFPDQKQALDDQINARMVELANYSSWYPQFFVFGQPIQVKLEVSLPQGWVSVCSGKKIASQITDGREVTRWFSPADIDILITAAPDYKQKSVQQSGVAIEIYHTRMPDALIERESRQITEVMRLFTAQLGETTIPAETVKHVYSPKRKGQGRAGIARPGMIVTSEGLTLEALANNSGFSLFQDIAHEIAHFWWNFGAGQGDWINEAFAEYFSAVAVQKVSSEEQFKGVIEGYRKQVRELSDNAPPISRVPFDGSGFVIRYYKGSLMLDHLRKILGDEAFFNASRDFFQTYKGKSIGTAEFRGFWRERLGEKKDLLDVWLDSAGGLPTLERKKQTTDLRGATAES